MANDLEYMDSNIVDYALLTSPCPTIANDELIKLKSSITTWGSFQITNIGLSTEFLDKVQDVIKQFFALPREEKMKYSRSPTNPQGYGYDGELKKTYETSSRLFLTIYPEFQRCPERWPELPHEFRRLMHEYAKTVKIAHDGVVRAMAQAMGLREDSFINGYGENPQVVARINFYPPSPNVEMVRGISRHSDASSITFLLMDRQVEALEVLKDDQWFKVPIIPRALVVLLGDQLEMMSNGILKSVEHRVKPNRERERISMALFFAPDIEKEVGPLEALVSEDKPPLYKNIKGYVKLLERHYGKAIRPITAVKI